MHRRTGAQHGHERLDRAGPQDGHAAAALTRSRTEALGPTQHLVGRRRAGMVTPQALEPAPGQRAVAVGDRRVDGAEELGGGRRVAHVGIQRTIGSVAATSAHALRQAKKALRVGW